MPVQPTPEECEAIAREIAAGRKIEAIRLYRQATDQDLLTAKEFVEKLTAELQEREPEKYGAPGSKSGCASAITVGLLAGAAVGALVCLTA
jgi:hypothetical protein